MPSPFVLLFLFHFYQFCAETAIAIFHFHLSRTHTSLCFPFAVFFFVAIIVSFDLFSVSSDFRWHSTLFCLLFGFGRVVLATLQRPCCANICHLTLVSLLVSVSFTALLFSLLLLFSFSSLSFWWGLWFSGSAFDLRCLIAGVVCGLQPWSIVNAFAHAAHKFLATFYVFFVLFFCFFWGYPTLSFPARNWKQRGVAVAETPTVAFEFWIFCIALRGSISASPQCWPKLMVSVQCPTTAGEMHWPSPGIVRERLIKVPAAGLPET